ncbi:UNVERIFIED_CONTAM: hypothetical protein FKN15_069105 [Acipenser sinensis]
MSSEQNREQTEGQSEFDSQCLVFAGSKEEDVDFAKVFWNSVSLQPPWESRLVSGDIRQRLKVANSSQQNARISHAPPAVDTRKEPFLLEAYIKEKTEEKLGNNKIIFSLSDAPAVSLRPKYPAVTVEGGKDSVLVSDSKGNVLNITYIIIPTIPLLLLLVVTTGVFCFKLFARRRKERTETSKKEPHFWMSPNRCSSPSLEVYSVIQKQRPADLEGTRPDIKNTSFRASSGHDLSGDYDNMSAGNSERGESGFVNNDIYETSSSGRKESGWVDNDIYGY